jgi:hypothetical protein
MIRTGLLRPLAWLGACLMAGCVTSPGPLGDQRIAWPGLPPDCWTESRLYQTNDDAYDWKSRTKIERIVTTKPATVTYAPNRTYYFALPKDPPHQPLLIFAEKDHFVRVSFTEPLAVNDVKWINEQLLYMRVWWGRIAATDLLFDVEQERMVITASTHDGGIAMGQYREGCALHGGCECVQKTPQ